MEHTISQQEFFRNRQDAVRRSRESQEQSGAESSMEKSLNPLGETFPFQCRCDERHQFSYIENEEGVRLLSVKLSPSGHTFLETLDPLGVCRTSEQRYIPVPLKSPNVMVSGADRRPLHLKLASANRALSQNGITRSLGPRAESPSMEW